MRVAVLGTGIMGAPIARNLAAAGHDVRVWNRTRAKAEGLGATVAETAEEAVARAEVLVTMLADGPAVEEVVPGLDPEVLWVQMSTVGVSDTARFAARHPRFLDAPVLGSKPQAEKGQLLVLAAGAERPETLFEPIAGRVMWLADEPGAGTKLKLATNLWIMNLVQNLADTFALAEALGVDPRRFLEAIEGRAMDSPYAHMKAEKMLNRDFSAMFTLTNAAKDIRLAIEAGRSVGLELGLAPASLARYERAIELGHGDEDTAAVWLVSRAAEPSR
ncbi:MAG TPA: NAD(P)-dependent oxidoreductase [Gaiellaceae bacterium]|nr:NAD(P)-dependent oxidoreductase [Gaiellaceae bacterium]